MAAWRLGDGPQRWSGIYGSTQHPVIYGPRRGMWSFDRRSAGASRRRKSQQLFSFSTFPSPTRSQVVLLVHSPHQLLKVFTQRMRYHRKNLSHHCLRDLLSERKVKLHVLHIGVWHRYKTCYSGIKLVENVVLKQWRVLLLFQCCFTRIFRFITTRAYAGRKMCGDATLCFYFQLHLNSVVW